MFLTNVNEPFNANNHLLSSSHWWGGPYSKFLLTLTEKHAHSEAYSYTLHIPKLIWRNELRKKLQLIQKSNSIKVSLKNPVMMTHSQMTLQIKALNEWFQCDHSLQGLRSHKGQWRGLKIKRSWYCPPRCTLRRPHEGSSGGGRRLLLPGCTWITQPR